MGDNTLTLTSRHTPYTSYLFFCAGFSDNSAKLCPKSVADWHWMVKQASTLMHFR